MTDTLSGHAAQPAAATATAATEPSEGTSSPPPPPPQQQQQQQQEAAAAAAAVTILPSTIRNLSDKMYEKRKVGAMEIEALVRTLGGNEAGVRKVLQTLGSEFVGSAHPNLKKGGMIALASAAIALGPGAPLQRHLGALAGPILGCLHDPDSRVRFYALEALYNLCKVARDGVLVLFTDIFDACCRLAADPDAGVRNATALLDRLLKDLVTQQLHSGPPDLDRLVPLLRRRVTPGTHPNVAHFIISWLALLQSLPDIDLAPHLPAFLDGLFAFLADPSRDVASEASALLAELLRDVASKRGKTDYGAIIEILVARCNTGRSGVPPTTLPLHQKLPHHHQQQQQQQQQQPLPPNASPSGSPLPTPSQAVTAQQQQHQQPQQHQQRPDEAWRLQTLTALSWLAEIVDTAGAAVLPFSVSILGAVLPHLSSNSTDISSAAANVDGLLLQLAKVSSGTVVPVAGIVKTALGVLALPDVPPRMAALTWLMLVHSKHSEQVFPHLDEMFPVLLRLLYDASEEVMRLDLEVIAAFVSRGNEAWFAKLIENLVRLFATDRRVLRDRAAKIVRLLCKFAAAERVFVALAAILVGETDLCFAAEVVQTLNLLLLSLAETRPLRVRLQQRASAMLFESLYRAWALSPASLFSLCLLCGMYSHASDLIQKLYLAFPSPLLFALPFSQ